MAGLQLLSDEGFRVDGRRATELRRIQCKMGVFTQADGSAYIEQGNTKVLAAVYGPHEVRGGKSKSLHDQVLINCQYSMAVFSTAERKRRPRGDRLSIEMTQHLKQTFETAILTHLCPRSQIDIYVEVLQSDGGNYCACVNAASLALMDAGVPMRDLVCACSASLCDDTPIVDVNHSEASLLSSPELIIALLPKSEQIVLMEVNGRIHMDNLDKVLDAATQGCKDVFNVLSASVREHVTERVTLLSIPNN